MSIKDGEQNDRNSDLERQGTVNLMSWMFWIVRERVNTEHWVEYRTKWTQEHWIKFQGKVDQNAMDSE